VRITEGLLKWKVLFRNLKTSLGKVETSCQGGQGSPRAVAPSEEEEDDEEDLNGK
jgi:hypothetical protein